MRYQGSEALDIDFAERGAALEQRAARPSFEVVPGGGLDARARRGVSPEFLARVKTVAVVACVLLAVGLIRVALSAAAVGALTANSALRSSVEDAQALNDDLKIERAVLSSNSRIARIATQNYGMALSADAVSVDLAQDVPAPDDAAAADESADASASEDAAADASASDDAQAAPSDFDGDAAQSAADGGASANLA